MTTYRRTFCHRDYNRAAYTARPEKPAPAPLSDAERAEKDVLARAALAGDFKSTADAKRKLQALLDVSDRAVYRAILAIYARQTATEQSWGETTEDNGVGFSGCDAELMSSFAVQIKARGSLTPKQMAYARKKARKYWKQLRDIIESKGATA